MRAGLVLGSAAATGLIYRSLNGGTMDTALGRELRGLVTYPPADARTRGFAVDEPLNTRMQITNYNNYYEFTTDKDGVAKAAQGFKTDGWRVVVEGMVHKRLDLDLDALHKLSPPEERIYRLRCVEAWSMVIPWAGFPLAKLLAQADPMGDARFVAFETLHDPARMPGQSNTVLKWPYVEGLRMDEAMHPLTLLATGLYGHELPPQDGAPIRLVVPWKYGFKSIKAIVKITVLSTMPPTSWGRSASSEYGFYANVNPAVDHPRWSQATEQRIGESGRRATLPFNGYGEQVASLYRGLDLRTNF